MDKQHPVQRLLLQASTRSPFHTAHKRPSPHTHPSITQATTATVSSSSTTSPPYFRITVKRIPGGLVSTHLHDVVEQGDALLVGPPYGDFTVCPRALAVPGSG